MENIEIKNEKSRKKLVFFYSKEHHIAGSLILFMKFASFIAKEGEYEVYYINYMNEELTKQYCNEKVNVCDIDEVDYSMFKGADFIVPINYLFLLLERIKGVEIGRVLLFSWQPYLPIYLIEQFKNDKINVEQLLGYFEDKNAVAHMDLSCYARYMKLSGRKKLESPVYVPVVSSSEKQDYVELDVLSQDRIRVGWLGRLDEDKIYALINLLELLLYTKTDKPIDIHIIGDGTEKNRINMKRYSPKIRFIFTSYLEGEIREEYIRNNIDFMVVMGMAVLDSANLSVPTLITTLYNKPYVDNRFVFLFDTIDYSLGCVPEDLKITSSKMYTIGEAIDMIYSPGGKIALGRKCYDYSHNNFNIEKSSKMLIEAIENSGLTMETLYSEPNIARQIKGFENYKKVRKNRNYEYYIAFNKKLNAIDKNNFVKRIFQYANIVVNPFTKKILSGATKVKSVVASKSIKKNHIERYMMVQNQYPDKIEKIRKHFDEEHNIKAIFLVIFSSVFPTAPIFEKMLEEEYFEPYIMVIPDMQRELQFRDETYSKTYKELSELYGDRVLHGYDVDSKVVFEPGYDYQLAFFNNPYHKMAHPSHHITYFLDKNVLPIYVNYGFAAIKYGRTIMKTDFYNMLWKACIDSNINLEDLKQHEPIKGINGLVTGYLKMDRLSEVKVVKRERKKIIICPHHTVMGWEALDISNFRRYAQFFVELPKLYPEIDFVFRPHPLLFTNLKNAGLWTEQQIEDYINRMLESENIVYDQSGDYFELFMNSDAMIHDCSSFTGEYLFTEKPCCYMLKSDDEISDVFNPMGINCMKQYYKSYNKEDIIKFIDEVVIGENDPMRGTREEFVRKELKFNYPNATNTVMSLLKKELIDEKV